MRQHPVSATLQGLSDGAATKVAKNLTRPDVIRTVNLIRARRPSSYDFVDYSAYYFEHARCLDRVVESDGDVEL